MNNNQNLFDEFCDSLLVEDIYPDELVKIDRKIEKAKTALEDFERMYASVKDSYDIAVESNTFAFSKEEYESALSEISEKASIIRLVIKDLETERSSIASEAMNKDEHIKQLNALDRHDKIEKAKKIEAVENLWVKIQELYSKIKRAFGSNYDNPECKESMKKFNDFLKKANKEYKANNLSGLNTWKDKFEQLLVNTNNLIEKKRRLAPLVSSYTISASELDELMGIAIEAKVEDNTKGATEVSDSNEDTEKTEESASDQKIDKEFDYIAKAKEAISKLKDDTLKLVDNKESKLADSDEAGKKKCMKIRETLNKLWGKDGSDVSDTDVLDSIKKKIGKIYITLTPAMEEIYNDNDVQRQVALMESLLLINADNEEAFNYAMESVCDYVDNKIWLQRVNELYGSSFAVGTTATESLTSDMVFDDIDKARHNLDLVSRMAEASIDRLNTFGDDEEVLSLRRECSDLIAECLKLEKVPCENINLFEQSKELLERIRSVDNDINEMSIVISEDEPEVNLPAEESLIYEEYDVATEATSVASLVKSSLNAVSHELSKLNACKSMFKFIQDKDYVESMTKEIEDYKTDNEKKVEEYTKNTDEELERKRSAIISLLNSVSSWVKSKVDEITNRYNTDLRKLKAPAVSSLHEFVKDLCMMVALESLEIYYGDEMYYIAMEGKQYDDLQAEFDKAKAKQRDAIKFYETEIAGGDSKAAQKFVDKKDDITGEKDLQQAANLLAQMRSNPKEASVLASQVASAIRLANSKMDNMQKGAAKKIDRSERRSDFFKGVTGKLFGRDRRSQDFNDAKNEYSEKKSQIKDLDSKIAAESDPTKKQQLEDEKLKIQTHLEKVDQQINDMKKGRGIGRAWHEMRARQLSKSSNAHKLEKAEQHRQSVENIDAAHEDKLRSDAKDLERRKKTAELKSQIDEEKKKLTSTSNPTSRAALNAKIKSLEDDLDKVRQGIDGRTRGGQEKVNKELNDRIAAHQQQTDKNLNVKTDAENKAEEESVRKDRQAIVNGRLRELTKLKGSRALTSSEQSEFDRLTKVNKETSAEEFKKLSEEKKESKVKEAEKNETEYNERQKQTKVKAAQAEVDKVEKDISAKKEELTRKMKGNAPEDVIARIKDEIKELEGRRDNAKDEVDYVSGAKERPKAEEVNKRTGLKPSEEDLVYKIFKRSINDITVSLEKDIDGYRKQVEDFVAKQKKRLTELTPDSDMYNECKTGIDLAEKLLRATSSTHSDFKASSKYGATPEEQAKMEEERLAKDRQQREALKIKRETEQKTEESNKKAQYQAKVDSNFSKVREVGAKLINSFGAYDQAKSELNQANKSNGKNRQQLINAAQSKLTTAENAIRKAYNDLVNVYGDYRTAVNDYNNNTGSKLSTSKLKMTKDLSKDLALHLENVMIGNGKKQHSMRDGLDQMITFTDSALAGYTNLDFTEEEFEIWCATEGFDLSNLEEYSDSEIERLTKAVACRLSDAYIASESYVDLAPATEAKDKESKQKKTVEQMEKIKNALEKLCKECKKVKSEKSLTEFKVKNILDLLDKDNLKAYDIGAKYIKKRAELKKLRYGLASRYSKKIDEVCKEANEMWTKKVWNSTETAVVIMKKIAYLSSKLTRAHANFMRKAEKELKKFEDVKTVAKRLHDQEIEVERAHGEALHMNKRYIGRSPRAPYADMSAGTSSYLELSLFEDMGEAFESSVNMQFAEDVVNLPEFILEDEDLTVMAYESLYEIISEEIENK